MVVPYLRQTESTCYFYTIINSMATSKYGKRLLLAKMKAFYKKLSPEKKVMFKDNRLCFRKSHLPEIKRFIFYKMIYNLWTEKIKKKKMGKSALLYKNLELDVKGHSIHRGHDINKARSDILKSLGISFATEYVHDKQPPKITSRTNLVVVTNRNILYNLASSNSNKNPILPTKLPGHPDFELDHALIVLDGHVVSSVTKELTNKTIKHAVTGVRLANDGYTVIDPHGYNIPCDWRNPKNFVKIFKKKWPWHSYTDYYRWDEGWRYHSAVYIRKEKLPAFAVVKNLGAKTVARTATANLGVNKKGRQILRGPMGGKYVMLGISKKYLGHKKI